MSTGEPRVNKPAVGDSCHAFGSRMRSVECACAGERGIVGQRRWRTLPVTGYETFDHQNQAFDQNAKKNLEPYLSPSGVSVLKQRVVRERTPGTTGPNPPAGGLRTWSYWSCNKKTLCPRWIVLGMHSRGLTPHGILLRSKPQLVLVVVLFSLLGLAHALQPKEREELDLISEEFQQTRNAPDDLLVRLVEKVNDIQGRLNMFEEELDQTREHVTEASVLTTRSVETLLWDLRAAKRKLSALEDRLAAQELESRRAAEACSVNAAKGKAARRKEAAQVLRLPPRQP